MAKRKSDKVIPKFTGKVDDEGKLYLDNRREFDRYLLYELAGEDAQVVVKRKSSRRSRSEEKYYHAVVCKKVAEAMGTTRKEAHKQLKRLHATAMESTELPNGETIRYKRVISTTEMDDEEYHNYIFERCIPWAALPTDGEKGLTEESGLGLYIPLPNEVDEDELAGIM